MQNPDLNATKECVQAGMAANLKQDYGAAEEERSRVFGLSGIWFFAPLRQAQRYESLRKVKRNALSRICSAYRLFAPFELEFYPKNNIF